MTVDEKKAKFKAERGCQTYYYFCSEGCLEKFQADPKLK